MDMNTLAFLGFFAVCALVYWLCPRGAKPYLLLAASYLFYCASPANRSAVWVLAGVTALTWGVGLALGAVRQTWLRRLLTALGALLCLAPLLYLKYGGFLAGLFVPGSTQAGAVILPLGISYFTFTALGYLFDVASRKRAPLKNPLLYALLVSFFPCVITGPIERVDHLLPQFLHPARFSYDTVAGGAFRMLWGYFKTMVLAAGLDLYISAYYGGAVQQTGPALMAAAALFSLRLYFNFSGSCDIVIGGARLFGIRLQENFNNPFLATSYGELWRRWHISLTGWFRDYVYIPLGGSRCGTARWALNLMLVFVLSGLWHGAATGYAVWGVLCGAVVLAERLLARVCQPKAAAHAPQAAAAPAPRKLRRAAVAAPREPFALRWLKRVWVFVVFSLCFVLFAASLYGAAGNPYAPLLAGWGQGFAPVAQALQTVGLTGSLALAVGAGSVLVFALEARGDVALWVRRRFCLIRWALYALLAFALLFFGAFGQSAFIYQLY